MLRSHLRKYWHAPHLDLLRQDGIVLVGGSKALLLFLEVARRARCRRHRHEAPLPPRCRLQPGRSHCHGVLAHRQGAEGSMLLWPAAGGLRHRGAGCRRHQRNLHVSLVLWERCWFV